MQRQNVITAEQKAEQQRQDKRDRETLRTMWLMIACGLGIFLGGFGIWTLDNVYCSSLRRWRRQVGLPWGILLEGHGWWYVYHDVRMGKGCSLTQTQASHDRYWRVFLHHLGNLASSLLERQTRRVRVGMAKHLHIDAYCRSEQAKVFTPERTSERILEKAHLRRLCAFGRRSIPPNRVHIWIDIDT